LYAGFQEVELSAPDVPFESDEELKEWVWQNHKEMLLKSMTIRYEHEESELDRFKRRLKLLDKVAQVQRHYLQSEGPKMVFGGLLEGILELMDSEYGFIGEVKYDDDGTMYLQTHAITNIAWDETTEQFYNDNIDGGLKFYKMKSLFGRVLTSKEPVISNNPKTDKRAGGIPKGHPPLNHFLGIPFFRKGGEIVGMVGISNKPGGYSTEDIEFMEPLTVTCSNLIQAYCQVRKNEELVRTLEEKVEERTRKLKLANESLERANHQVRRASIAQLQHFACMVSSDWLSFVFMGRGNSKFSNEYSLLSFLCTEPRDSDALELHCGTEQPPPRDRVESHAAGVYRHDRDEWRLVAQLCERCPGLLKAGNRKRGY
jgi:hypothetical protein